MKTVMSATSTGSFKTCFFKNHKGIWGSAAQSDEFCSHSFGPIVSILLPDSRFTGQTKFISDIEKLPLIVRLSLTCQTISDHPLLLFFTRCQFSFWLILHLIFHLSLRSLKQWDGSFKKSYQSDYKKELTCQCYMLTLQKPKHPSKLYNQPYFLIFS